MKAQSLKKLFTKAMGIALSVVTVVACVPDALPGFAGSRAQAATYDYMSIESLKDIFGDRFKMGIAVQAISHWNDAGAEIGNPDKEKFICNQFNSMTFGNEFKPAYNFDAEAEGLFTVDPAAEELLDWAKANGIPVRGHCLVWHSQVDPSIFAKDFKATSGGKQTFDYNATLDEDCLVSRDVLLQRLKTYIYSVIEYTYANGYAETIYAWDVVNEAIDEGKPEGYRQSYWYQIIGGEFLYYSFLYTREAEVKFAKEYAADYGLDPEGDLSSIMPELFYNDYNEWFSRKTDYIIEHMTQTPYNEGHKMVKSDVINPDGDGTIYGDGLIDGFGLQAHMTDADSLYQYKDAIEKYAAAINNLHVTELDVGKSISGEAGDFKQAKYYYDYFKLLCDEQDAGVNITSVTVWGLTDPTSWRKDTEPLLFHGNLSPKPAFEAVVMAGKGEEFTLEDTAAKGKAEDTVINFEPDEYDSSVKTPEDLGFISRGSGHQATIMLKIKVNHTEDAKPGFSLQVRREEADATVRYDLTRFIGHTIRLSYYVKSEVDPVFRTGIDGYEDGGVIEIVTGTPEAGEGEEEAAEPVEGEEAAEAVEAPEWYLVDTVIKLPEGLESASLYFETDGAGEFYIDDFTISVADDMEVSDGIHQVAEDGTVIEEAAGEGDAADTATPAVAGKGNHAAGWIAIIALAAFGVAFFMTDNKKKTDSKKKK